jgi:hypothetical protein
MAEELPEEGSEGERRQKGDDGETLEKREVLHAQVPGRKSGADG